MGFAKQADRADILEMTSNTGKGFSQGWGLGTSIANAQYNERAYKNAAKGVEQEARLKGFMVAQQYEAQYRALVSDAERRAATNQVAAQAAGITGDSANAALQSYAAKDQRNLERLYYNAAMQTGALSVQYGSQAAKLREKAAQYKWEKTSLLIQGVAQQVGGFIDYQTQHAQPQEAPYAEAAQENEASNGASETYGLMSNPQAADYYGISFGWA